jgi:DNA-binding MarR family transcriptional regulator
MNRQPKRSTLATRLIEALLPLIRDSQAEIMAATAELEFTLSQQRIMFELQRAGEPLAVNDVAERVSLSLPATGRAIDALYRSGMVSRREDEADRRIKRIALAEPGRAILARVAQVRLRAVERFVAGLSAEECADLDRAVAVLATLTASHLPALSGACDSRPVSVENSK